MKHAGSALGTVFLIAIGSVVTALLSGEQWLAWLLLGATLILPLGFASIRDDWRLATVVYLVIACHHGLAVLLTFGEFRPIDLWDATYFEKGIYLIELHINKTKITTERVVVQ